LLARLTVLLGQKMKFETKYEIKDKVLIPEIDCKGRILSIHVNAAGLSYNVRYYLDGKQMEAYFETDELVLLT